MTGQDLGDFNIRSNDMRKRWITPLVAITGLVACQLVLFGDTEVRWGLSGTCADYGIKLWEVTLTGRSYEPPMTFSCTDASKSLSSGLITVEEGTYTASVRAISAGGTTLATRSSSGVIMSTAGTVYFIDVGTFSAADFTGGAASVKALWTINDTEDGTENGLSFDTCDEVGAAYVRVTLDGTTSQDLPCGTSKQTMNGTVSVAAGSHTVTAVMLDASKTAITHPTQQATLPNVTVSQPVEFVANFAWSDFLSPIKENTIGTYRFDTSFENQTCSQVNWVTNELSLILLNGQAVTPAPQVCDAFNFCYAADGNSLGKCSSPGGILTMSSSTLKWGSYKLKLQGTLPDKTACYSVMDEAGNKEIDILIGAGTVNPVDELDLKKITPAAAGCL